MNNNTSIRTASRALLLALTVAALKFVPYDQLTNLTLIALAGLLAVPIAAYRLEYRLFARRAVITQGCTQDGFARRRLWNGSLLKIVNYIISMVFALLVLVVCSSLNNIEWVIVLAATAALILAEAITLKFAQRHTTGVFQSIFQRGFIKWPVIAFIVITSSVFFINSEYPNYVGRDPIAMAKQPFYDLPKEFSSPVLGYTRAALTSMDKITMYIGQNYIPRIDDSAIKWSLWSYLALKSAISTGLIVYLLLGILTLASIKERRGWMILGRTIFEKYFTLTLIFLLGVYLYASNVTFSPKTASVPDTIIDCSEAVEIAKKAVENRERQLTVDEQQLSTEVGRMIDKRLEVIFGSMGPGIEKYLDWHFSVLGEYQQLGTQLLPTINQGSRAKLEQYVMAGVNAQLSQFGPDIDTKILNGINASAQAAKVQLPKDMPHNDCHPSFNYEPPIFEKNPVYVGHPQTLVAGGALATLIAKKTAAKVSAKGIGKVAGKYAASAATGLTLAGFCGPFAPICGVSAAVVTWFAVDAIVVSADEIMNRDELRQDILNDLDKQKTKVKQQMISLNTEAISASYDILGKTFMIPTNGVGNPNLPSSG